MDLDIAYAGLIIILLMHGFAIDSMRCEMNQMQEKLKKFQMEKAFRRFLKTAHIPPRSQTPNIRGEMFGSGITSLDAIKSTFGDVFLHENKSPFGFGRNSYNSISMENPYAGKGTGRIQVRTDHAAAMITDQESLQRFKQEMTAKARCKPSQ